MREEGVKKICVWVDEWSNLKSATLNLNYANFKINLSSSLIGIADGFWALLAAQLVCIKRFGTQANFTLKVQICGMQLIIALTWL